MQVINAILGRSSARKLQAPGPSPEEIGIIISCAAAAPDHGRLQPWRFVVISDKGRERLGQALADHRRQRSPDASDTVLRAEREKAMRAPTIVAVAARTQIHKVPISEQLAAVAAGVQNMILAANDLGYGTMWKTGDAAYSEQVKTALGFNPDDDIIGFIYLGRTIAAGEPRIPVLDGKVNHLTA